MRADSIGLFWQDSPVKKGPNNVVRKMPPIPDTGWTPPTEFPNLSSVKLLSLDTETKDPNLTEMGPGWARKDGHIIGFSLATHDAAWYFPIRHEIEPEFNLNPDITLRWLRDVLYTTKTDIVGANLMYDVGWLRHEGVTVYGTCYDIQFAEALLDETLFSYSLDSIAKRYLAIGKDVNLLYQWCADYYGGKATGTQGANFYRAPPRLVGPYAETDARLPLQVLFKQIELLQQRNMYQLFDIECRLIPLLVDMRMRGVRVDIPTAERVRDDLLIKETQYQESLDRLVGFHVEVYNTKSIEKAFKKLGLSYPRTTPSKRFPNGNPSFRKEWLAVQTNPLAEMILQVRKLNKARSTFVENAILQKNVDGRLYTQFHPLKSDDGGTVSGRFSSRTPNLQQVPARDKEMAQLIRQCFVPDEGFPYWWRGDYSQIEYRLLAHFAVGPGADEIRQRYNDDPDVDYHEETSLAIKRITNVELDRKPTKNINFGLVYGMSKFRLIKTLNVSDEKGNMFFNAYHDGVPFVQETFNATIAEVERDGVSRTLLNRQTRFDRFNPIGDRKAKPLPYEQAVAVYGSHIERSFTHKSLNRKLQGSAADILKVGMLLAYESGLFNELGGAPHLTVHDELDNSYHPDTYRSLLRLKSCMEEAIKISVPIVLGMEIGTNWANVKEMEVL